MLRTVAAFALMLLSLSTTAQALEVDLRKAQKLALEANLELRAQTLQGRASSSLVKAGYGVYDPQLIISLKQGSRRERVNQPFFNLSGSSISGDTEEDRRSYGLSLSQKIPTGAELTAELTGDRGEVDPQPGIDPAYASRLQLRLNQPLLKGFGRTVTEKEALRATEGERRSLQELREKAFDVLTRVRKTYFDVLRLREQLSSRLASVELAKSLQRENIKKVEAGLLAPVEALEAAVGLQLRERERLDAERLYLDALDRLATLLDLEEPPQVVGELERQPVQIGEESGATIPLDSRPDILRQKAENAGLDLEKRLARDSQLPALDLSAGYSHAGLTGSHGDSIDELSEDDLRSWDAGLTLSYPLGNRQARYESRSAELLLQEGKIRLQQLSAEARKEVRAAIRLLEVSDRKIKVTRLGRELAQEQLRILIQRQDVGLATTRQVLEGEEDLAEARTLHSDALAEYNGAVTDYYRATGQLLEREGVVLTGGAFAMEAPPQ